jgi:hypothetical protein
MKTWLLQYWDRLRSSFWFVPAAMACDIGASATHTANEYIQQHMSWFIHHHEEILMKAIWKNTVVAKQVNDQMAFWRGAQGVA